MKGGPTIKKKNYISILTPTTNTYEYGVCSHTYMNVAKKGISTVKIFVIRND